jgi:hypothetical protein
MTLLENVIVTLLCLDIVRKRLRARAYRALHDSIDLNHLMGHILDPGRWSWAWNWRAAHEFLDPCYHNNLSHIVNCREIEMQRLHSKARLKIQSRIIAIRRRRNIRAEAASLEFQYSLRNSSV